MGSSNCNIDFLKWNNSNLSPNSQTAKLKPLINQLFNRILPHSFSQLVTSATRHKQGEHESGLDQYYTNKPEKVSNIIVKSVQRFRKILIDSYIIYINTNARG